MALRWFKSGQRSTVEGGNEGPPSVPHEKSSGLQILNPPAHNADVDIVAVHGLGGDAFSTWTSSNDHFWLRDSLPQALETPPADYSHGPDDSKIARVMTFGYDASVLTKASSQRSFTFAENLLSELKDRRHGQAANRPLIFMGHSLGGIVIKKALLIAQSRPSQWGDILKSVVHLCFFGTPHQGTSSALLSLGSLLTKSKAGSVLEELKLWSPSLIETNQLWVEIADGFTITSFYERNSYMGVLVVPEGSARLNRSNETVVPMDRDHITICKFGNAQDSMFLKVFGRLHAEVAAIGTISQSKEQAQRVQRLLESHQERFQAEDQQKVLEWLAPPGLRPPVTHREPGTNEWFVQGELFHDWLSGEKQYLFLHGTVGCGKTTLLKSAAKSCRQKLGEFRDRPETFVITFFFSSTTNQSFGLNDLLRYLIAQLSPLDSVPDALYEMYSAITKTFPPQPPNEDEELTGVLSKILAGSSPTGANSAPHTYILLDGLDEIATLSECRKVTNFLNRLAALSLQSLHILVISRSLELANPWQPVWEQYAIPAQEVAQDIERYVRRTVSRELDHLTADSQRKIITGLTGPKQTMFRYTDLQLQTLLESGLLLDSDIDETLSSLPSTLNETYDSILQRIQRPSHKELAKIALRWIAVAHRPLLIEELIEACTVRLEAVGQVCEEPRLSPAKIIMLLRHLVVLEKSRDGTTTSLTSTAACKKDSLVFAHFSVREYLTTPRYMEPKISPFFAIELKQAHLYVASSCVAYLLRTNTLEERKNDFSLREYAWDLWALHAVLSTKDAGIEASNHAQDLFEQVAFGNDYAVPEDLQRIVCWADSTRTVLDCLRNPYFFEEYDEHVMPLNRLQIVYPRSNHNDSEIRLLRVVPNQNRFAGVRCRTTKTSLGAPQGYEAVSYTYGSNINDKHIWLNGRHFSVPTNGQASLRAIRKSRSSPQNRLIWIDSICIIQPLQHVLIPSIFASAVSVTVYLEDASGDEVWALEIIRLIDQLLTKHSESTFNDLSNMLCSRQPTDPFFCLKSLFQRPWWRSSWVLQEAVLGKNPILLYGIHVLPLTCLENFANLSTHAFQLISNASRNFHSDPSLLEDSVQWENVLGLVRMRAHMHRVTEARNTIRLLYASRYRQQFQPTDLINRFTSLRALMTPDAPTLFPYADGNGSNRAGNDCVGFCSYTLISTNNLDLFSVFFPEKPEVTRGREDLPSWADYCLSSVSMASPRPLLYRELIEVSDGPFCAGGREFQEAPMIDTDKRELHLQGFAIGVIEAMHDTPLDFQDDQAELSRKGYGEFGRLRRWFRISGSLAVLGPKRARVGCMLTVLIGGKTPYLLKRDSKEANHFRLVGECYVDGLMHGEYLQSHPAAQPSQIILV